MNKKGFGALAVVLIVAVVLALAGGVWYYMAHKPAMNNPQSQAVDTTQATSTDQNAASGSEFFIPKWGIQFQEPAGMDDLEYSMNTAGNIAFFSTKQLQSLDQNCTPANGSIGALSRSKSNSFQVVSTSTSAPIGGYYYAFTIPNGMCSPTLNQQAISLQGEEANLLMNTILSTLATSGQNIPSPTTPAPTSVPVTATPSSNSQSGIDTLSWQTESIHFNPFSICWTIKYPPTLFPMGANGGESSDEEFVSSQTLTPPVTGVTLAAVFNETYSSVATDQTFSTDSGLNGSIATNSSGNWRIFIQASEGGKDFVLVLNPYYENGLPPLRDLDTAEAMARSITLSCAIPASPN